MLPHTKIESALQSAVRAVLPDADVSAVLVRPCDPKFGDYQSNALMSLAKTRKLNPRQLATDVVAKLDLAAVCEKVEIAGAGFLNFRLKNSILVESLQAAARGEHLFFAKAAAPKTTQRNRKKKTCGRFGITATHIISAATRSSTFKALDSSLIPAILQFFYKKPLY